MNNKILSIKDVLENTNAKNRTLLLGNGFSMGYDYKRFSFTSLFDSAIKENIIPQHSKLISLFDVLNTRDFENVIKHLQQTASVLNTYSPDNSLITEMQEDADKLKGYLIEIVMNNHPENVSEFDIDRSKICANFIQKFNIIYTLNYDLLLYWVIMQNGIEKTLPDDFGEVETISPNGIFKNKSDFVEAKNNHSRKLFFLHGALHLFDNKINTIKLCWERQKEQLCLKEQIEKQIDQDIYPIFISEGTYLEKLEKIRRNDYLHSGFKSLQKKGGELVILGTVLKSNDTHIAQTIIHNNNITKIFMGVFNDDDKLYAEKFKRQVKEWNDSIDERHNQKLLQRKKNGSTKGRLPEKDKLKEFFIFDTSSFNPWKDDIDQIMSNSTPKQLSAA